MMRYRFPALVVAVATAILGAIALAMYRLSFDVWAGLVIAPLLILVTVPLIRRILHEDGADVFPIMVVGYVLKLAGSCARYYVVFDAYGKNADAERYFDAGNALGGAVRRGDKSVFALLPLARDARFIERLSALVMTPLGPSRLAGFFVFSTFAFLGTVCCVRAACMAVPRLARRRYALILALAPSLVFWPSSLGKEAWIICCLGAFCLGFAKVITWNGRRGGVLLVLLAALGMGAVRPHFAAITMGSAVIGFAFNVLVPSHAVSRRGRGSLIAFTGAAAIALALSATAAVRFLDTTDTTETAKPGLFGGISNILNHTSEQTTQGGSSFPVINIDSPLSWPYATFRTLTRPLLYEAHSVATLLPALETTFFLAILIIGWRRTINLPNVVRRSPYMMFALFNTFLFGLAFTAIGNLGILVRQRSIVVPFVGLLLCLPQRPQRFGDRLGVAGVQPLARNRVTPVSDHATLSR